MSKTPISTIYPTMLPFFKMVAIYFIVSYNLEDNKIFYTCAKIAPIIALIVILQTQHGIKTTYIKLVSLGLLFSAIGDMFLVYRTTGYLIHGTFFFSVAHFLYIAAFGFSPVKKLFAIPFLLVALISYYLTYHLLSGILSICLPLYMILVCFMGWRGLSQLQSSSSNYVYKHMRLAAALGGVSFVISDVILCTEVFELISFPHSGILVMVTYYAAQFGIATSALKAF